jgi:hypothetical protein
MPGSRHAGRRDRHAEGDRLVTDAPSVGRLTTPVGVDLEALGAVDGDGQQPVAADQAIVPLTWPISALPDSVVGGGSGRLSRVRAGRPAR